MVVFSSPGLVKGRKERKKLLPDKQGEEDEDDDEEKKSKRVKVEYEKQEQEPEHLLCG